MKNKLLLPLTLAGCVLSALLPSAALADPIDKEKIAVMNAIGENDLIRPYQSGFPAKVRQNLIKQFDNALDLRRPITVFGKHQTWQSLDDVKSLTEPGIQLLRVELSTDRFTKGTLQVEGVQTGTLFLDGVEVSGKEGKYSLTLYNGDHRLLMLTEQVDNWKKVKFDYTSDDETHQVTFHKGSPKHRLNAKQMFDAQTVNGLKLSPDGKQFVWTKRHYNDDGGNSSVSVTELVDSKSLNVVYRWQGMTPGSLSFSPDNRHIVFAKGNDVFLLERQSLELTEVAGNLQGAYGYNWLDGNTIIFTWNRSDDSGHEFTKRYRAVEDRWGGWRDNAQLYLLDVRSGFIKQLTESKQSVYLLDIDRDNNKLLFGRELVDYQAPAHTMSELLELDIVKQSATSIGKYRTFNGASYGPQGLYVLAGPSFANNAGLAAGVTVPNDYDTQLYFMNRNGQVEALSKDFDPSISSLEVMADGNVLLNVVEQDRTQLYSYIPKRKEFQRLNTQLDVIGSYSVSKEKRPNILYRGSTSTSPQKVFITQQSKKARLLLDTAKTQYANTEFSTIKDWDYTNSKGELIDGRYYLPPDFDASKQYPTIVYYYGGTSSVKRAFTGRWPFSLWAAQGYVVYVLQPSGAPGYGQKFSAKHVNAWGKDTADDIIDATKAFVAEHKFVDGKRLANMGASYGGFMTMLLATKTDLFAASISHAGISNLSEYWGYGWWGYSYSGVASRGSFPWNNPDLYVKQSPLYSADKVTTPLLLIHGDSDTNVPVTESHQMYTALKLLNKDVELVEFAGDDHHINSRDHRLRWWSTILAYLDMKLKDQPLWWQTLYPDP